MLNVIIAVIGLIMIVGGVILSVTRYHIWKEKYRDWERERRYSDCDTPEPPKQKCDVRWILLILVGVVSFVFSCSFTIIPTGYTGVKVTFGQIDETPLPKGFNLHVPFVQSIKKVNNKQQDVEFEEQIWSETSARTPIFYKNVVVTYTINPEKSAWIYAHVTDYTDSLVSSNLIGSGIKSASKTLSDTDATNRDKIEPLAAEYIQNSLDAKYGEDVVFINKVVVGDTDFEEGYNTALAEKQKAQLEYEKQQIENKRTIEQAEADAQAKIKKAEGEAEAQKIQADAEAEANKKVSDSLSSEILERMFYEKWDGKLPYSMGSSTSIMDISKALEQDK